MKILEGKVAVVTGAARGLGRAMAGGLVAAGAKVVGVDLPGQPELDAAGKDLGASFVPFPADIRDEESCANIIDAGISTFGAVHVLVNNAGIGMDTINLNFESDPTPFWKLTAKQWRDVLEVNSTSHFLMARAVAPRMIAQKWGRIINVTTSLFTMVASGFSPYGPSKAALEASTAIWAKDLAGTGVTVNALLPGGPANTRTVSDEKRRRDRDKLVQPEQMIPPVVWLASTASDSVTGRRFIAANWAGDLPAGTAALLASSPAAW